MSFESVLEDNNRLLTLRKWLSFELPGSLLFAISFFYNIATTLFMIAVVVFTPYMLYVLAKEKRYGWIVFFMLFVALPGIASYYLFSWNGVLSTGSSGGGMLAGAIPMALYLFYCYFLKLSIPGMLDN
ncbi:hypothetical protein G3570_03670 [Balneolaceae bacterium YR4-1]|uniref:Uncharacterized protein n=1 Tax=Halalkalibaculum roseum TaxID=2709311 RepID=A0A6M1T0V1_9BACT|nr:hypothetical protein [Halalkalibaculum roseum]NGP75715.1 hypothetical protein [Halalkalibaculum roseum]